MKRPYLNRPQCIGVLKVNTEIKEKIGIFHIELNVKPFNI